MKLFKKKADAEISVRVFKHGKEMENAVMVTGNTVELWSGFEAICRGLLETVQKQGDQTAAAVFAEVMEKALQTSREATGVKTLDELLCTELDETEEEE